MKVMKDMPEGSSNKLLQVFPGAIRKFIAAVTSAFMLTLSGTTYAQEPTAMMVRISEIEIVASQLNQYKAILAEEAQASVQLEPGVIAIFPMYEKVRYPDFFGHSCLVNFTNGRTYETHKNIHA